MMNKQTSQRRSGRPLAGLLAAVFIGLLLAGCELGASDAERMSRAETLSEQGDLAAAIIELRNVLQNDPVNVEARLMLARLALAAGDSPTAAKEYRRALDLGADPAIVGAGYMKAMVANRENAQAVAFFEELEGDADPAMLDLYGQALLGTGEVDKARAAFQSALAAEDSDAARLSLAALAVVEGDEDAARAQLDAVSESGRGLARYWQVTGDLAMRESDAEAAIQAYNKAIELNQPDPYGVLTFDARARLGEAQLVSGDLEAARATAQTLLAKSDQHPLPNYLMARLELQSDNPAEALIYAQKVLTVAPNNLQARLLAGAAALAMGNSAQAQGFLAPAVAQYPQSVAARQLLAQAQIQLGESEQAIDLLSPALDAMNDNERLAALMGLAQIRAGRADEAIEMFRKRLEADPANNGLRLNLANALLAAKRPAEAAEVLGDLTGTEAEQLSGDFMLLSAQLRSGDQPAALAQAERIAQLAEANPPLLGLIGSSFAAAGQLDVARDYFKRFLVLQPQSVQALRGLGRLDAAQGNNASARKYFEAALDNSPNDPDVLIELSAIAEREGDREEMERLMTLAADAPDSGNRPKLLLAQIKVRNGDMAEGARYAEQVLDAAPGDPDALNILGLVALSENNSAIAQSRFEEALKSRAESGTLYFNLARANYMSGNVEMAQTNLRRAMQLAPEALLPSTAYAEMSLRSRDLNAAAAAIANLKEFHPEQPATVQLQAELDMAEGKVREAEAGFRDVLERTESRRALLGLYGATKRLEGDGAAIALLEQWLSTHPDDEGVRLLLAQERAASGQSTDAKAEYEAMIEANPDNGIALNNLAWMYAEEGDPRAVEYAERAVALLPESGNVADTLGWALYKSGENSRAIEVLRGAVEMTPADPTIRYHLALALAAAGENAEALKLLREVLNDPAGAGVHADAQRMVEKLGGK